MLNSLCVKNLPAMWYSENKCIVYLYIAYSYIFHGHQGGTEIYPPVNDKNPLLYSKYHA